MHLTRHFACSLSVTALVLILPASLKAQESPHLSPDFIARISKAANSMDISALNAATAGGVRNDYRWASKGRSLVAPHRPWQIKTLRVPWIADSAQNTFINFSKYHPCESTADHLYRVVSTDSGPKLGSEIPETETSGYRVRDHKLTVRFDLSNSRVHITDRIEVEQSAGRFPAALLRLNSIYSVAEVSRGGAPVDFLQAGGILAVKPDDAEKAFYDLKYTAKIGDGPEDYLTANQAGLTAYWYAHTGRLPATHEVAITVPRGWAAIGQGEQLGKNVGNSETTYTFSHQIPVCYFTVAAGKYTVTTRKVHGIDVSAYLLRPDAERAQNAIQTAGEAIDWFSKNLSPYPYKTYAVVETDIFPAALECYSWTLCAANYIPLAIVHEVAHTWWGGIVPNTYTRSLWNESFAEYSDGLYSRVNERPGLHDLNSRVMAAIIPTLKKVTLATANDAMEMSESVIGYGKGSAVLENLERMVGREKMIACMQRFIRNHRQGEDAEWADFIKAVTQEAGEEWAAFFPPWLTSPELPKLKLAGVKASSESDKYVVTGSVTQSAPAFWIRAPLMVQSTAGTRTEWIDVKGTTAAFRFQTSSPPTAVWLDPQREVLRALTNVPAGPSLLRLHALDGPLLVVYATGGSPAEAAVVKRAARYANLVVPGARARMVADRSTTLQSLNGSHVLLVGKPQHLRIPAAIVRRLPFRYTESTITDSAAGISTKGTDIWGLTIQPHPANPNRILAHTAGTAPDSLLGFRFQERLTLTESRFIATARGNQIAARRDDAGSGEVAYLGP